MKVAVLLANQFIMLNLDLVMDTFRIANRVLATNKFTWQVLTVDSRPVASCNGFVVQPDANWFDGDHFDCILVITGFEPEQSLRRPVLGWLKAQHELGVSLGCIDTGAFALAAAGVLTDNPIAIHWELEATFRQQYPHFLVNSYGISCSDKLFSSSGGLSVADMMLELLSGYMKAAELDEVKHILYRHGAPPVLEKTNHVASDIPSRIERAELTMQATLATPLTLSELAGMVNMHPRTFARHFQTRYGMTPMRYYRQLRLNHARSLLLTTSWSVARIAELCGFTELTNFSTCFKQGYGVSPRELRLRGLMLDEEQKKTKDL